MNVKVILIVLAIVGGIGVGWWLFSQRPVAVPITPQPEFAIDTEAIPVVPTRPETKSLALLDIHDVDTHFRLNVTIPTAWQVAAVVPINAITIYDPTAEGTTPLEQSQIFLRYFEADTFLTLTTVDILERTELALGDRAAVRYRIHKKASVANFANQPSWRNDEHEVTDIREVPGNPSTFYVIARNPALSDVTFNKFLDSLLFDVDGQAVSKISEPTEGFVSRVTLKPFGILINEATSPVQPERFSGYHTAADAEFASEADRDREILVRAVLDGEVVVSRTASGYGGLMVLKHELDGKQVFGIYGHLKPTSMLEVGAQVKRSDQIAILGAGDTSETDGERKHLHFGIYTGSQVSISGYVSTKEALSSWLDPLSLLKP